MWFVLFALACGAPSPSVSQPSQAQEESVSEASLRRFMEGSGRPLSKEDQVEVRGPRAVVDQGMVLLLEHDGTRWQVAHRLFSAEEPLAEVEAAQDWLDGTYEPPPVPTP